jgi:hypothetical protein
MPKEARPSDLEIAYRTVFQHNSPVLEDLLSFCGVFSPNLAAEPLEMARNEGRRLVGLRILGMLGEVRTKPKENQA